MIKLRKTEIVWLVSVILFYVLYNLPFVPPYGNSTAAIVHGILTLIPLWISVYIGFFKICKIFKIKEDQSC